MKKLWGIAVLCLAVHDAGALAATSSSDAERLADLVDRLETVVESLEDRASAYSKDDRWLCTLKTTMHTHDGRGQN